MRCTFFLCGTLALGAGCGQVEARMPALPALTSQHVAGEAIAGRYIVLLAPGRALRSGAEAIADLGAFGRFALVKAEGRMLAALRNDPAAAGIEADRYVFAPPFALADPLYPQQWHLPHLGAKQAWERSRGQGVVVAVVDSGVDYTHPDLRQNMVGPGYSFVTGKPDALDVFGHGTHVAGIMAAVAGNGEGVAGLAPEARILPVGVLDEQGVGSAFRVVQGIKYAADYGRSQGVPVVINLSLAGPFNVINFSLIQAGKYAVANGALPVAAAGNDSGPVGIPARYVESYTGVSALGRQDERASFSNFGPEIALAAPGVAIMSTMPTYDNPSNGQGIPNDYAALSGTSMAAPLVGATCALVWSRHQDWTPAQVRDHVMRSALDLGPAGRDDSYGAGLIQPAASVR